MLYFEARCLARKAVFLIHIHVAVSEIIAGVSISSESQRDEILCHDFIFALHWQIYMMHLREKKTFNLNLHDCGEKSTIKYPDARLFTN